jgi:glutathionylspermidine synthase
MIPLVKTRCDSLEYGRLSEQHSHPLRAEPPIDPDAFSAIRRRAVLEGCKWDPQVGDVSTLAPFPLVLKSSTWTVIASQAEQLAAEAIAAEEAVSGRPELVGVLGFPPALRRLLSAKKPASPSAGRVVRFDFHYTTQGWRISEANSDVPGGFTEASYFTALMAEHFPNLRLAGCPVDAWADALGLATRPAGVVGLLSAPGYMEDHQVIAFLASRLHERGCRAHLLKPEQVVWRNGIANLNVRWHQGPLDLIVRFYQSEWLARLPERCGWANLFRGGKTPVANPGLAAISESKRFPLVWDRLPVALPMWHVLLPETRDPREVPWARDEGWLLKTAMCNTGDTISIRELMPAAEWLRRRWAVQLFPGNWVAQRRFESVPVPTPLGPRHVCLGVYTVNGQAVGVYARLAEKPLIDFGAVDVALLLEDDE